MNMLGHLHMNFLSGLSCQHALTSANKRVARCPVVFTRWGKRFWLSANGTWRSQSFSEGFVHSIRLHLLDHMGSNGVRVRVRTRPNTTTAVGLIHRMNLKIKYFMQILRLEKTKECRLQYKTYLKYQIGDVIQFQCGKECISRTVVRIERYPDLESMFSRETLRSFLPHLSESDVAQGVLEYLSFFNRRDLHLGVVAFHLSPTSREASPKTRLRIQKPKLDSGKVRKKVDLFNEY